MSSDKDSGLLASVTPDKSFIKFDVDLVSFLQNFFYMSLTNGQNNLFVPDKRFQQSPTFVGKVGELHKGWLVSQGTIALASLSET